MNDYDFRIATHNKFALSVGETFENDLWRVHRYANVIKVTYLLNAGKRGKACVEFAVFGSRGISGDSSESQTMEFTYLAKKKVDLSRMEQAMKEVEEIGGSVERRNLKGVDVKPGNFQKLFVRGAHITVEADYDSYVIKDINDEDNEPTCIAQGKKSVFAFYRWVKENAKSIQAMTMKEAMDAMKANGIDYHYYCAMD